MTILSRRNAYCSNEQSIKIFNINEWRRPYPIKVLIFNNVFSMNFIISSSSKLIIFGAQFVWNWKLLNSHKSFLLLDIKIHFGRLWLSLLICIQHFFQSFSLIIYLYYLKKTFFVYILIIAINIIIALVVELIKCPREMKEIRFVSRLWYFSQ